MFDDDALIISYLFDYKINNYRCRFPIGVINKVTNVLEEKCINYVIKGNDGVFKDFKKKNNYYKYLDKSRTKDNINKRINNILDKLSNMNEEELKNILCIIEDRVYE